MSKIVCIGSGNMGYALMKGACGSGGGSEIYFTDVDAAKAKTAADSLKANVLETNTQAFEKGDFIFLAVKPQVLSQVLTELSAPAKEKKIPFRYLCLWRLAGLSKRYKQLSE
nr:Pyrroline-5-carboxylate reductase [uncultured bacterium]